MPDFGGVFLTPRVTTWAGALLVLVDVAALASIWRSRAHSRQARVFWTALVAFLPLVGAAAWFLLGRERRGGRPS
jgi:hypothetical protein